MSYRETPEDIVYKPSPRPARGPSWSGLWKERHSTVLLYSSIWFAITGVLGLCSPWFLGLSIGGLVLLYSVWYDLRFYRRLQLKEWRASLEH